MDTKKIKKDIPYRITVKKCCAFCEQYQCFSCRLYRRKILDKTGKCDSFKMSDEVKGKIDLLGGYLNSKYY